MHSFMQCGAIKVFRVMSIVCLLSLSLFGNAENQQLPDADIVSDILSGRVKAVQEKILKNPELVKTNGGASRYTLLHYAAKSGFTDIIRILVNAKSDINAKSVLWERPLHLAVHSVWPQAVGTLLDLGANPDCQDRYGQTPLHYAASTSYVEQAKVLIENKADVNIKDYGGYTPLQIAIAKHDENVDTIKMITCLLSIGADVNAINNDGQSALHLAAINNDREKILPLLVSAKGANINLQDEKGQTPLILALKNGGTETILKLLLDHGADVNIPDNTGLSPLFFVKTVSQCRLLIDKKADVNLESTDGYTPVLYAINFGYIDVVKEMVRLGANLNHRAYIRMPRSHAASFSFVIQS